MCATFIVLLLFQYINNKNILDILNFSLSENEPSLSDYGIYVSAAG